MKIAAVGIGYVGLSNAVLLAQHHDVVALDIVPHKVDLINAHKSPIVDREIEEFLASKPLHLRATTDKKEAYEGADFVVSRRRRITTRRRISLIRRPWSP